MKIQLKDVLFNEPFWHTEEYAKANMTHYCFKIAKSYNGEKFVDYTSSMGSLWGGKSDNEVWVNRDEPEKTVVLSDPMTLHCLESAVDEDKLRQYLLERAEPKQGSNTIDGGKNQGGDFSRIVDKGHKLELHGTNGYGWNMYVLIREGKYRPGLVFDIQGWECMPSPDEEKLLLTMLLERAGLVAITEHEKDQYLALFAESVRNVPVAEKAKSRVVEINWGEETDEEFAERHRVKAVDVPVGMVFYTNYNDFNLDNEGTSMTMRENLKYLHNGYGHESETPLSSEFVYVSHPEKCNVEIQTPVRTEKEIQEPSTPVLMVEARLETLEKSITFRKEALANLSEDLYSSRITYLVELRAMDMLKTSLTSLLEDLEELVKPDEQIRQMDLNSKNDF